MYRILQKTQMNKTDKIISAIIVALMLACIGLSMYALVLVQRLEEALQ